MSWTPFSRRERAALDCLFYAMNRGAAATSRAPSESLRMRRSDRAPVHPAEIGGHNGEQQMQPQVVAIERQDSEHVVEAGDEAGDAEQGISDRDAARPQIPKPRWTALCSAFIGNMPNSSI